jgi:DNA-binding response OmpR family regulator
VTRPYHRLVPRVLVVDDEPGVRRVLKPYLVAEGFDVAEATTGEQALDLVRDLAPDVVVLDVMLPGIDGVEVLRRLRTFSSVYVVMVTARGDEIDKLIGLSVGADDYVTKPFSPREVVARVKAVLRRQRPPEPSDDRLVVGSLELDLSQREVRRGGSPVELTTLEFDLLTALASSPGRVFTRRQLLERVWGTDYYGDERVVDVHVRNLRKALDDSADEPAVVATVRGVGYKVLPAER